METMTQEKAELIARKLRPMEKRLEALEAKLAQAEAGN